MTRYVVEYKKDGQWFRVPRLHESYAIAEIACAGYDVETRVVPINEANSGNPESKGPPTSGYGSNY